MDSLQTTTIQSQVPTMRGKSMGVSDSATQFVQLSSLFSHMSAILTSLKDKVASSDGSVSTTALVWATLGGLSFSIVITIGTSSYLHIKIKKDLLQVTLTTKSLIEKIDLSNKSTLENLLTHTRESIIKPETKFVCENEMV
jgi:hypothetical protein